MSGNLDHTLSEMKDSSVVVSAVDVPDDRGTATVQLLFSDGIKLQASYWRLIANGREAVSSLTIVKNTGCLTHLTP